MVIIYWEGAKKVWSPVCGGGEVSDLRRGIKKVLVDNHLMSILSNAKRNFPVYKTLARV